MKIEIENNEFIYNIVFNKITLYIDNCICLFLSKPTGKNYKLEFNTKVNYALLKKFKLIRWDLCKGNYLHLKFLATYSPILSKFIDPSEFDDIKVIKLNEKENNFFLKIKDKNIYNIWNVKYNNDNDDDNVKITIEEYNNDSKNFLK